VGIGSAVDFDGAKREILDSHVVPRFQDTRPA
jgi:hypothetical protein